MDFDLDEEHRMLRETVREFVAKEVAPRARHVDETGEFPWETLRTMGKLGLLGLNVPEKYGGVGADALSVALMLEEVAKGCGSTGLIVAAHLGLACGPLVLFGTEAQKQRWLKPMAQGKMLGCLGLTEAGAGSDLRGIRTTAGRDRGSSPVEDPRKGNEDPRKGRGGDGWMINGSKMWLTNGAEAGLAILLCKTGEQFSLFLVPTDTPGVQFGPPEKKMGLHGSHTYAMSLEDVAVPAENLLGVEGRGLAQTLQVLDAGRIGIAALSLGLAEGAFDTARGYAKTRRAFGQLLIEHEAIAFTLADMAAGIEAARWLVYHAAWLRDQARPYTLEASIAKLVASEMAERVARDAIQVLGGYGYSAEYPVERIYRDARLMTIGEGTSEIQRLVIARHIA